MKENKTISVEEVLGNYLNLYISLAKNTGILCTYLNGLSSSFNIREATGNQTPLDNSYKKIEEAIQRIEENLEIMIEREDQLIQAANLSAKNTLKNHRNFIEIYIERKARVLDDIEESYESLNEVKETIYSTLEKGKKIVALRGLDKYKTRINKFNVKVDKIDGAVLNILTCT
jgi:hypothetical protein